MKRTNLKPGATRLFKYLRNAAATARRWLGEWDAPSVALRGMLQE